MVDEINYYKTPWGGDARVVGDDVEVRNTITGEWTTVRDIKTKFNIIEDGTIVPPPPHSLPPLTNRATPILSSSSPHQPPSAAAQKLAPLTWLFRMLPK